MSLLEPLPLQPSFFFFSCSLLNDDTENICLESSIFLVTKKAVDLKFLPGGLLSSKCQAPCGLLWLEDKASGKLSKELTFPCAVGWHQARPNYCSYATQQAVSE